MGNIGGVRRDKKLPNPLKVGQIDFFQIKVKFSVPPFGHKLRTGCYTEPIPPH